MHNTYVSVGMLTPRGNGLMGLLTMTSEEPESALDGFTSGEAGGDEQDVGGARERLSSSGPSGRWSEQKPRSSGSQSESQTS